MSVFSSLGLRNYTNCLTGLRNVFSLNNPLSRLQMSCMMKYSSTKDVPFNEHRFHFSSSYQSKLTAVWSHSSSPPISDSSPILSPFPSSSPPAPSHAPSSPPSPQSDLYWFWIIWLFKCSTICASGILQFYYITGPYDSLCASLLNNGLYSSLLSFLYIPPHLIFMFVLIVYHYNHILLLRRVTINRHLLINNGKNVCMGLYE